MDGEWSCEEAARATAGPAPGKLRASKEIPLRRLLHPPPVDYTSGLPAGVMAPTSVIDTHIIRTRPTGDGDAGHPGGLMHAPFTTDHDEGRIGSRGPWEARVAGDR